MKQIHPYVRGSAKGERGDITGETRTEVGDGLGIAKGQHEGVVRHNCPRHSSRCHANASILQRPTRSPRQMNQSAFAAAVVKRSPQFPKKNASLPITVSFSGLHEAQL